MEGAGCINVHYQKVSFSSDNVKEGLFKIPVW